MLDLSLLYTDEGRLKNLEIFFLHFNIAGTL